MISRRTDLAHEAHQIFQEANKRVGDPDGIVSETFTEKGIQVTRVEIRSPQGEQALGKPQGTYVTVDLHPLIRREPNAFADTTALVARQLRSMLPPEDNRPVLVTGLGNRAVTPDAYGPWVAKDVIATRHLLSSMPEDFSMLSPVTVLSPGVLGSTGLESGEQICGISQKVPPRALIVIDALAARRTERLCRSIQISDAGLTPGSGVGNHRFSLNRETMGVPCIAIGVPTVVDSLTLAADLMESNNGNVDEEEMRKNHAPYFVTSREIDAELRLCARVTAYAINKALQPGLSTQEIELFLD